jgi:hypothetical protein
MRRLKTKFRNDAEWEDYACDLLGSPDANVFARALYCYGWIIVDADGRRWPMQSAPMENDNEWEDYAFEMINGPNADVFARAVDAAGLMIIMQPEYADGRRWPMNNKPCPSWADGECADDEEVFKILDHRKPPQPHVIDADKKDDA